MKLGKLFASLVSAAAKGGASSNRSRRSATSAKRYAVPVVGEQHYQAACSAARAGDRVRILAERANPHDSDALAVEDLLGRTLGYIPRDSWLRRAIMKEGKGCSAVIEEVDRSGPFINVYLEVTLTRDGIGERKYRAK